MNAIILIAFIAPALFYLGARARLTQPIHSRYPSWLVGFMNCAACAGGWYGMLIAVVVLAGGWEGWGAASWLLIPAAGLAMIWWTPVAVDLQENALMRLAAPPMEIDLSALRANVLDLAETARTASARAADDETARTFDRLAAAAEDVAASL